MRSSIILTCLALSTASHFASTASATEEICVACDRKVLLSGDVNHARAFGVTVIEGAPRRGEEAFREEIYGTNFTLTVSTLPAGKYTVVIGLAEVDFPNAGQRVFDITCGDQMLASNLDIFAAAGGAGKVCFSPTRLIMPRTRRRAADVHLHRPHERGEVEFV